jgi:hypothetical protein
MAGIAIRGGGGLSSGALNPALLQIKQKQDAAPKPAAIKPLQPTFQPAPVSVPAPAPSPVAGGLSTYQPPAMPVSKAAPAPAPEFKPQTYGPGNNLINQQISAPSSGSNSYDSQAAQYAQNANVGDYSALTGEARQMILDQLKNLQNAPDRFALAQSNYDLFQRESEPAYQQALRGVGQKAAALGRVGAGMTTNDLTGALGQRERLLSGERTRGINEALSNTLQDRLNISGAINNGAGLLGSQDLGLNTARSNAALGQAGVFSGLGQNQWQREYGGAQLQAQQQAFQASQDQQNIANQIAQQQLQMQGQNQSWQQQYAQQALAAQIAAQQNTNYPTTPYVPPLSSGALGAQSAYAGGQLGYNPNGE